MVKRDLSGWSKDDLIKEVEALRKQKTYGLVWEKDKTKEAFDYYINWDGQKTEEKFPGTEHKLPVLKEVSDKEIITDKEKDFNLLIEGDNYHSLAALNFTHNKSIDVIYIDPPYNTGNKDFKYNDQYVDLEDAYRHSKWLSFMEKRIKLARELLKDGGLIVISIDDNEQAQLRILCDEIFGGNNFISNVCLVNNLAGRSDKKYVATAHEYLLFYRKTASAEINGLPMTPESLDEYNLEDQNGKYRLQGLRKRGSNSRRKDRPNLFYPIYIDPVGKTVSVEKTKTHNIEVTPKLSNGNEGCWRWEKKAVTVRSIELVAKIVSGRNEWDVFQKDYLFKNGEEKKLKMKSFLIDSDYSTDTATTVLRELFDGMKKFDSPKSHYLIKDLIRYCSTKNGLVLDFFAGSGTTGHAVLDLNKEDGGSRRFILCTNNENNICTEVCYPRINKVIKGYKSSGQEGVEGLGGNLKYFKTDFVDSAPTDKNKKKIVDKSTEMICIKENAFIPVKGKREWKIFKNHNYYLGIVFDEDSIEDFVKEAKKLDKKIHVYVFSLDGKVPEKEFKELKNKAKLCPIPEVILHVYRRIFK
ncbi:MAG: site-specific DNA-methyltransferase [Nanoarchaeota archaeon]